MSHLKPIDSNRNKNLYFVSSYIPTSKKPLKKTAQQIKFSPIMLNYATASFI